MMTTEHRTPSAVSRAALVATAAGAGLVGIAALVSGSSAALGAAVGGAIAVGVYAFGTFSVDVVSRLAPSASLMFALLTYTFQVLVMLMVFVGLSRSSLLGDEIDRSWLGGAIIVGTLVWMAVQIRMSMTARIPAFETTVEEAAEDASEPTVRTGAEAGAR